MRLTRREGLKLVLASPMLAVAGEDYEIRSGPFTPEWESLQNYRCPDWFRQAKLGIWAVWGPEAVPEVGDWYARNMYIEGSPQYKYHLEHYGHPSNFGYKDIVPLWKAERWDPERLIGLYKKAGARYFISIANHHDNFDCWNSKHHRWNSVQMGPKKDIVGTWRQVALKQGLRFGVTEHNARSWSWFNVNKGADKRGPYAGVPYDGNDPKYQDFYFPPHEDNSSSYPKDPPPLWTKQWFLRTKDLIDSYRPDLMYYDGGVPFGEVGRRIVAHMYNQSVAGHNGKLEAVFNVKNWGGAGNHGEYREGTCVLDMERGVVKDIWPNAWQTDTCIGDWYYKRGIKYRTPPEIIHQLADIVSKNGNLLLNIPPRPDGTLDPEAEDFLSDLGKWMAVNGEAIYATSPWKKFGEGPNQAPTGHMQERKIQYSAEDIRFTAKGGSLYAIALGVPRKEIAVRSLAGAGVKDVKLLGAPGPVKWRQTESGLIVSMPEKHSLEYAVVLKVVGRV